MATTVELATYRRPEDQFFLNKIDPHILIKPENKVPFEELMTVVRNLGLTERKPIHTTKDNTDWFIHMGLDLAVPDFPRGESHVSTALALYHDYFDDDYKNAILRFSPKPFEEEEFRKDIQALTKYYVERPLVLGFPSKFLANVYDMTFPLALVGGAAGFFLAGGDIAHPFSGNGGWGVLAGDVGFMSVYLNSSIISEWYARLKTPRRDQYIPGDFALTILGNLKDHIDQITIQKELYSALESNGVNLEPDDFLTQIYDQIPPSLIKMRIEELGEAGTSEALPKMVSVAKLLI